MSSPLTHLYISPLELCNLCCKICYTTKTSDILTPESILDFVARYQIVQELSCITFCGGEVMLLSSFPKLVNSLTSQGILIQIITNGTANRLTEFTHPNLVTMIVSLDGLPSYHDSNRGVGNFQKSLSFLHDAKTKGFHLEIFSIVTQENLGDIIPFENLLRSELGELPDITYHPRKSESYLAKHPFSNQGSKITNNFSYLTTFQINDLSSKRNIFPPSSLGCHELSLMSTGKIYGCCEGITELGDLKTPIKTLIKGYFKRLSLWQTKFPSSTSGGCVEPDFICGK